MYLCTTGSDGDCCIFDNTTFDMIVTLKLVFVGEKCCWINDKTRSKAVIAITCSNRNDQRISLYDPLGKDISSNHTINRIANPCEKYDNSIVCMIYIKKYQRVMSCVSNGNIEIWTLTGDRPKNLNFSYLIATDYCQCFVNNPILKDPMCSDKYIIPLTISISPKENWVAIYSNDNQICVRIFEFIGKNIQQFNDSLHFYEKEQSSIDLVFKVESFQFGRLVAKELKLNILIENDCFYPTILGIKIVSIRNGQLLNVIGKSKGIRFLHLQLFQRISRNNIGDSISQNLGVSLIDSTQDDANNSVRI